MFKGISWQYSDGTDWGGIKNDLQTFLFTSMVWVAAATPSSHAVSAMIFAYVFLGLSISVLSAFALYRMIIKESASLGRDNSEGNAD